MQLNTHKKCLLLETDLEPSSLAQWLGDNAGLTTQLVEEVVEPYTARCAEHLSAGTTWNEAAKRASQKHKPCAITTSKIVRNTLILKEILLVTKELEPDI